MTVLAIGIMAVVAGFSASALSLQRASKASTAGVVADAQMEGYRALSYAGILLDGTRVPTTAPYTTDAACAGACGASSQLTGATATCAAHLKSDPACPSRSTIGPDQEP